ncbi:hypothetical protein [Pedobacter sp. BMA]|uniref:hypothetical protein n=1 Tax=Pedobacter sp. BMA TaxID=1663685 RepID=UPI00064A75E9|nr:hypothetical protein [Pedobacter sp. BMA]KLT63969.1 hypothetical protein AB669_19820 [Pedobacter sp. BMA]
MTADKKVQAIKLLKQGLETIQARAYTEIAEIPTDDQDDFQVKYSFVHEGIEGIFTVIGKAAPAASEEGEIKFTLLSEFAEDSLHYESATAREQVDNDLISAESYLNDHINQG